MRSTKLQQAIIVFSAAAAAAAATVSLLSQYTFSYTASTLLCVPHALVEPLNAYCNADVGLFHSQLCRDAV